MGMPLFWTANPSSIVVLYAKYHTMQARACGDRQIPALKEEPCVELDLRIGAPIAKSGRHILAAPAEHADDFCRQAHAVNATPGNRTRGGIAVFIEIVVGGLGTAGLEQILPRAETPVVQIRAGQKKSGLELDRV